MGYAHSKAPPVFCKSLKNCDLGRNAQKRNILFAHCSRIPLSGVVVHSPLKMATADIPTGTVSEISFALSQLADQVLASDPATRYGSDARRLYRIAVRQLEVRHTIIPDQLVDALLYDCAARLVVLIALVFFIVRVVTRPPDD
jgi:hypothetical protein